MNDKVFLDTNILIYCYTITEPIKQAKAQKIADLPDVILSTQVLKEFANTLTKKFKLDWPTVRLAVDEVVNNFPIHTNSTITIRNACKIAERYRFSFYDSLIISAALERGCNTLYSEDMQDGQVIEGVLYIKNPL